MDRRTKLLASALVAGVCTACSSATGSSAAGGTSPAAATTSATAASTGALRGVEALTPPPPDPAEAGHVAGLAAVPDGAFSGSLRLRLSGLTAYEEKVTGSCAGMGTQPVLAVHLADGTRLAITFAGGRATSRLQAPGIDEQLLLDGVHTTTAGSTVAVMADLLAAGTSERVGDLALNGRCA